MQPVELSAFRDTAARFVKSEIEPMLGAEARDGHLSRAPEIIEKARQIGLCAGGSSEDPGYEYGVWGTASNENGPLVSLVILEEISKGCAGIAASIHAEGLGARENAGYPEPCAVAFFEPGWTLDSTSTNLPPVSVVKIESIDGNNFLSGTKDFVLRTTDCTGTVVYAQSKGAWQPVFLPDNTKGLTISVYKNTMGLAALQIVRMKMDRVEIVADALLPNRTPEAFLANHLLGLCAITLGNAKGAWESAKSYALERYQGGQMIDEHDAVRILLGDALSRLESAEAFLYHTADQSQKSALSMQIAFAAKLRISIECAQAVTDCLQVLGGYGYMEDYRLEKRLRDALTIKSMSIGPDRLRALCFTSQKEGAR